LEGQIEPSRDYCGRDYDMNRANSNDTLDSDILRQLNSAGLSASVVLEHQHNVKSFIGSSGTRFFPINDTCRLDNGGIIKLPTRINEPPSVPCSTGGVIAFVPAAGASSRYLAPFAQLIRALDSGSRMQCLLAKEELVKMGLLDFPIPDSLRRLLKMIDKAEGAEQEFSELSREVLSNLEAPKALFPAVRSGETFLEIKRLEHLAIQGLQGEVFVGPPGRMKDFLQTAARVKSHLPVRCYEQGPGLSTVRFDASGEFARTKDNRLSFVPGGHGTLIRLFKKVAEDFSGARAVFIRNIDNVSGTGKAVMDVTRDFMLGFDVTLDLVQKIRIVMRSGKGLDAAAPLAIELLNFWGLHADKNGDPILTVLARLFHSTPSDKAQFLDFFERPVVLMGQVPNTGSDVGGSCVFTNVGGLSQKLCLELPHASPEDKKIYLEDSSKSTHFNPVFVLAELPSERFMNDVEKNPFWLISKKKWEGRDVFYQESILYELLGSSQYTNVIFTEIPRMLFNPHKTISDANGKSLEDWMD